MGDIQEFVSRVVQRFRPQRIILFGSHGYGRSDGDSDLDLPAVMPDGGDPLGESIEITKEMPHNGFALDLIVRDPVDPAWRIEHDDFFLQEAARNGVAIYEAEHIEMGRQS